MDKYIDIIKTKIDNFTLNYVFISKDFIDEVDYETVRKSLNRLAEKNEIKKISRGYYYKPIYMPIIDDYSKPDVDSYCKAIGRNMNWKIFPTGNTALNVFGLSTQVPANYSYISSGRTCRYELDDIKIDFIHRSSRETDFSFISGTVIQALKAIGQHNITDELLKRLGKRLSDEDKKNIIFETKRSSAWIFEAVKKICKELNI